MNLALGILDQSPVVGGADAEDAIDATFALVGTAERLGYGRYWFAEHHGRRYGFASASPELMIARAAGETRRMRLGSGGVLLQHYNALKVAENFHLLEAIAPGRIDLGIGRGTGARDAAEAALEAGASAPPYEQRVADLLAFLGAGFPAGHSFASVVAAPAIARAPEPWLLGSTGASAALAAALGLPFAYAHFIKGDGVEHTAAYRAAYRPSERFPHPRVLICVAAYCSPDPRERADYLACLCLRRARMQLEHDPLPPTREEAQSHVPSAEERRSMEQTARLAVVTSPDDVRARLEEVATQHGADEALIVSVTPDYATRTRSYEAIARAFDLWPVDMQRTSMVSSPGC